MEQKMEVLIFFKYAQKGIFPKNDSLKIINFDHSPGSNKFVLTSLLVFACIHFEFQQVWLQWRRGGGTLFCF